MRLEGLGTLKNPPHPGLEPATLQLVAYCLNQLRYRVPQTFAVIVEKNTDVHSE
jgi:hypothetical protein